MLMKIFVPLIFCTSSIVGGGALAADAGTPGMPKPEVYKESQMKPHAKPAEDAVKPGAPIQQKNLYKNSQPNANAAVKDRSVNPDAPINKKLYKESQKKP